MPDAQVPPQLVMRTVQFKLIRRILLMKLIKTLHEPP